MQRILIILMTMIYSNQLWARSLKSSIDQLVSSSQIVAGAIGILGLILAGAQYTLGKQNAGTTLSAVVIGIFVIAAARGIFNFIAGVA
jgi:hypothetical protein